MAQVAFTATISSTHTRQWIGQMVAEKAVHDISIVVRYDDDPTTIKLDFLLNSARGVDDDTLLHLGHSLQNILDGLVAASSPFQVRTGINRNVFNAYYQRGRGDKSTADVAAWLESVPSLYHKISRCKNAVRGKTAFDPISGEQVNVSATLNSDANYFAVFMVTNSSDGIGSFSILHKDTFTHESMTEARRFGCKEKDRGGSIVRDTPYIDFQALGAEFRIIVPETEVDNMLEGTSRVYAVLPGINKYPAVAQAPELMGLHCQDQQREFRISHLVPCFGTEASFITGKKCKTSDDIFRRKKEEGSPCDPFTYDNNGCCEIGQNLEDDPNLPLLMYFCLHKRNPHLSPKFSFLNDILEWYQSVKPISPLSDKLVIPIHVGAGMDDAEKLLVDANPAIITSEIRLELSPGEHLSLGSFFARLQDLRVRDMHTTRFLMGQVSDFSLDQTFNFLKANRPKVMCVVNLVHQDESNDTPKDFLPSVDQIVVFLERVFQDRDFDRFNLRFLMYGEISDPRSKLSSKGYKCQRYSSEDREVEEDDDQEFFVHYSAEKQHVSAHVTHTRPDGRDVVSFGAKTMYHYT